MRLTFKLLLFPFLLFVGIYAATPLWLPHVLARQLPPGWQLEFLDTGYPGITGIGIKALRATGELQGSGIAISASKIRFSYRDLRTDIDSLAVDVKMGAGEKQPAEDFQLDDISLPVTRLTGKLPQLSINHLLLSLHHVTDLASGNTVPAKPLEIHVGAFELTPRSAGNFHLAANVELYEFPLVRGRFELETAADSINAGTWFQSGTETLPWLAIQLEQRHLEGTATTQIKTVFDTELADPTTLDSILQRSTGNVIRHVDGKLEMEITFAGRDLQRPERLSVVTQKLRAESNRGTLGLEAGLLASREGDNILVTTTNAATFRFQDKTGWIDELIKIATPGVVRTTPPDTNLSLELDSNSRLLFRTATNPSIIFGGDIKLHLSSIDNRFSIHATELQIEADNTLDLETTTANGMITVDWEERVPFAYSSDDLALKADRLSLSTNGHLLASLEKIEFNQAGSFKTQIENLQTSLGAGQSLDSSSFSIQGRADFDLLRSKPGAPVNFYFNGPVTAVDTVLGLPGDEHSAPVSVTAENLSFDAELISRDGSLASSGGGFLLNSRITPPPTSAKRVDLVWKDFNLINMTGNLETSTQGLVTIYEDQAWTGFDLDIMYRLLSDTGVNGFGTLMFDKGPELPIEFNGNIQSEQWNIRVPATTVSVAQLGALLRAAHFELPASLKLTSGYLDMQATVTAGDETTAQMVIEGHEMNASLAASSVRNGGFKFDGRYGETLTVSGPVTIESIALAGGIDVAHVKADMDVENTDAFSLNDLYAEVFDGQLVFDSLKLKDNLIEETLLELSHISLDRLLAFADIDGLTGTGFLEISLPVATDKIGVYVKNGIFRSTGPGHLAYTKEGLAAGNISLQALENFQYQVLSGTVNYLSDGTYRISVRLEGQNPDLYDGHAVAFNLNINGMLPELFETLFMTGNFEDAVLQQIKRGPPPKSE